MRTLPLNCQKPELWMQDYSDGNITSHELFGFLIMCAKTNEVSSVVSVVPEKLLPRLRQAVREMAHVKDDHDLIFIGDPPFFGVPEVRKMNRWFDEHAQT